jgi:hypothetical protein
MVVLRNLIFGFVLGGPLTLGAADSSKPDFSFRQVDYFHRWVKDAQYEFTPAKQEDLEHWSDLITINGYQTVGNGEELAETADKVLGNYKSHGAKILNTRSMPRTKENPAEHLIVAGFNRPDFVEAAFARFKLYGSRGYSLVYSHRFYGKKATEEMKAWLEANGEETEKALMEWDPNLEVFPAEF